MQIGCTLEVKFCKFLIELMLMEKKPLSKEELIKQLKAISETEVPDSIHMGAMCYCPAPAPHCVVKCESCCKQIELFEFETESARITKIVNEIKELGYDVKIKCVCSECAAKLGITQEDGKPLDDDSIYHVFYFKANGQDQYHVAESSYQEEYKVVLAFLKNELSYRDSYDWEHFVKEDLDVIKKMTGISIE